MALEEPVAEIDGQIDLVRPLNLEQVLILVNIDSHEFVADLRCVLSCIYEAELF